MQTLNYTIGRDRRALAPDLQNFNVDFSGSKNWVQARQYERSMRQVFVNLKNDDGTLFDLTGCNVQFEGMLPDKTHRIIDAKHAVMLDAVSGQFRFDMPAPAFAVAGSYVQAFFRIMKDGNSITTLEFSLEVLADKVISGLIPADYITPFEDLYGQLEDFISKAGTDYQAYLDKWQKQFADEYTKLSNQGDQFEINAQALISKWEQQFNSVVQSWNANYSNLTAAKDALDAQFKNLSEQINAKGLVTQDQIAQDDLNGLVLNIDNYSVATNDFPRFVAYGYYNGAGIPQTVSYFGVPEMFELKMAYSLTNGGRTVLPKFTLSQLAANLPDFRTDNFVINKGANKDWVYLISGPATIGIHCVNANFS